jgi:hypothetical protein
LLSANIVADDDYDDDDYDQIFYCGESISVSPNCQAGVLCIGDDIEGSMRMKIKGDFEGFSVKYKFENTSSEAVICKGKSDVNVSESPSFLLACSDFGLSLPIEGETAAVFFVDVTGCELP